MLISDASEVADVAQILVLERNTARRLCLTSKTSPRSQFFRIMIVADQPARSQ